MKNLLDINPELKVVNKKEILYVAKKHWISFVIPVFLMTVGIIGILPLFFGIGLLKIIGMALLFLFFKGLISFIKKLTTKIYVTQDYITISSGFIDNTVNDISLGKIEGSFLGQGIIGKIFNFGTFTVTTGAVTQQYAIKNPMEFRKFIVNHNKEK